MIYDNVDKFLLNTIILFINEKHYYKIKNLKNNTYEINISKDINNITVNNIIKQLNKLKNYINNNYKNKINNKIKIVYDRNVLNILIYYIKENTNIIYDISRVYYYNLFLNVNNNKIELSIKHINKDINIINEINKYIDEIINKFKNLIIN